MGGGARRKQVKKPEPFPCPVSRRLSGLKGRGFVGGAEESRAGRATSPGDGREQGPDETPRSATAADWVRRREPAGSGPGGT